MRYGDYFAQACTRQKTHAEVDKIVGWESLSKAYWTEIAGKIYEEEAAYDKVLKGEKLHEQVPTHLAIHQACNSVGFNMKDMLSVIMHYAKRNELMHTNFVPLIRAGKFKDISTILHNDLYDLRLVCLKETWQKAT